MIDSAYRQFRIDRENRPLQRDLIANFPAILVRQLYINQGSSTIVLPGRYLVWRNYLVGSNLQILIRVRRFLSEEILRTVILISPSEPRQRRYCHHSWNTPNLFPVITG